MLALLRLFICRCSVVNAVVIAVVNAVLRLSPLQVYLIAILLLAVEIVGVILPVTLKVRSRSRKGRCERVHIVCMCAQVEREKFQVFGLFLKVPSLVARHLAQSARRSFDVMVAELERDADAGGSGGSVAGDDADDDNDDDEGVGRVRS